MLYSQDDNEPVKSSAGECPNCGSPLYKVPSGRLRCGSCMWMGALEGDEEILDDREGNDDDEEILDDWDGYDEECGELGEEDDDV